MKVVNNEKEKRTVQYIVMYTLKSLYQVYIDVKTQASKE